jgi:hypothetical protein
MLVRRFRLLALAAGVALAGFMVVHATGSPAAAPGRFLTWTANATPEPSAAPTIPVASSSPAPASSIGGLQIPLESMLQGLNADTAATANGQYNLLQELEAALRDRIDRLLDGVGSGR